METDGRISQDRRRSSRLLNSDGKRRHPDPLESSSSPTMSKNNNGTASALTTVNFTFDDIKKFMNGEFRTSLNEDLPYFYAPK